MKQRTFFQAFRKNKLGMIGLCVVVFILLVGICAPLLADYPKGYGREIEVAPSAEHWMGTDNLGLDVMSEIIWGARTSVYVSLMAVLCAAMVGIPLGLISGYHQGRIGGLIDSIIEIFMTLPMMPLMIVIAAVAGAIGNQRCHRDWNPLLAKPGARYAQRNDAHVGDAVYRGVPLLGHSQPEDSQQACASQHHRPGDG